MEKVTYTGTPGFKALARDSEARNQGPSKELLRLLDPDGRHVLAFSMVHNGVELRNMWMCKLKDRDDPVKVLMDNGFEEFKNYTAVVNT